MTIIVASRVGMWADSKVTKGETSYRAEKIIRHKGELVGSAGGNEHIERFLRWYQGKRDKPMEPMQEAEFEVVVVSQDGIYVYNNCSLREKVLDAYYFAGAGDAAAEAAIRAGADPRRAVEIACSVVNSCGLPVQEELL